MRPCSRHTTRRARAAVDRSGCHVRPPSKERFCQGRTPQALFGATASRYYIRALCARCRTQGVPDTFAPQGLLIPVASMSIAVRNCGSQILDSPGTFNRARSILDQLFGGVVHPARHLIAGEFELHVVLRISVQLGLESVGRSLLAGLGPKT